MDVVIVGPCGSGKSTLVRALHARGYAARTVAQEHSIISELWRHGGPPAALVVLDAQPSTIARRRAALPDWLHAQQIKRLASARAHADLLIPTDEVTPDEVVARVLAYLHELGVEPTVAPHA